MGLDPVVVQIAHDGAPWTTGDRARPPRRCSRFGRGRMLTSDDLRADVLDDLLDVASRRAVARFVDAWIGGHYCFGDRVLSKRRWTYWRESLVKTQSLDTR